MATHSSTLAWESPWKEEPGGLQFMGLQSAPGEGIGYPFPYLWAFHLAQTVKNLPAMQEAWV